ncbi:hypothetical protein [Flavobacterium sp.]
MYGFFRTVNNEPNERIRAVVGELYDEETITKLRNHEYIQP